MSNSRPASTSRPPDDRAHTPQPQQSREPSRRRGRSRSSRPVSRSWSPPRSDAPDDDDDDESPRAPSRSARRRKNRKQNHAASSLPPVDETEDTGKQVANKAGGAVQGQGKKGGGGEDDPLRLRLDLNLEVEIELKAKVHGDITLALL